MTSTDRTGAIDAELRNLVEKAFDATTVDIDAEAGSDASPAYRSDDAEAAWKRMHDAARGREIAVLLEMLDGTWLGGEARWKAVTFLGYSLRTPEAGAERESILRVLAVEAAVKNRGSVPSDVVRVQKAALRAIAESPIGADAKWQCMLDAVQASRSHFGEILEALSSFRPSSAASAGDALPILLDAMVRSDRLIDLDSIARVVRDLDIRSGAPDIRRLLLAATSNLSARIAPILADWGDTEATPEVRRSIHQYSTASDPNVDDLVDALYRLQGSACVEFIAEEFRSAPPALQEYLLDHSLRKIPSGAIAKVVRQLAESTRDVDLKQAAQSYLDAAPAAALEEEPAALTGASASPASGAGPAGAAPATPDSAETASWQPVFEDTSATVAGPSVAPGPSAVPAPSAVPSTATAVGSWQPTSEDPQAASAASFEHDEARSRRLRVEAEALARIREEAARLAEEQKDQPASGPDPLELLVRLPQILFALAILAAILVLLLSGE